MAQNAPCEECGVLEDVATKTPRMYRVLLHNDDYTTMEFVVEILCTVFRKQPEQATAIMLTIHERGIGECGVYSREIAETKAALVRLRARAAGYPLKCTFEAVE